MHFAPRLRDDHQRMSGFSIIHVFFGQTFRLITQRTGNDRAQSFETSEGFCQFTGSGIRDSAAVAANTAFFLISFAELGILAANLPQLGRLQMCVAFKHEHGVRGFHRPMLARVAGENQPAIAGANQPDEFCHLLATDLTRFVQHHDGMFWHRLSRQEVGERRRRSETTVGQIPHLLALRGKCHHGMTRFPKLFRQCLEYVTFSRARPAAKQRDEIPRHQQSL